MSKFSTDDWKNIGWAASALSELCWVSIGVMSMNRLFPRKHFLGKVANFGLGYFVGCMVKIALADKYAESIVATSEEIERLCDKIDQMAESNNEVEEA